MKIVFLIISLLPLLFVSQDGVISVDLSPYSFSLDPETHQMVTEWELVGISVSRLCAFCHVSLVELGWTGGETELSPGHSWAVTCTESATTKTSITDRVSIQVDITKYKVQPFKSYKVCVSLEEKMAKECTHLFSFEKSVPYVLEEDAEVKEKYSNREDSNMEVIEMHTEERYEEVEDIKTAVTANFEIKMDIYEDEGEIGKSRNNNMRDSYSGEIEDALSDTDDFLNDSQEELLSSKTGQTKIIDSSASANSLSLLTLNFVLLTHL